MHITKTISLAAALLVAGSAYAHEGEHTQSSFAAVIAHYATHLDHLLPLAIALILVGAVFAKPDAVTRIWRAVIRRSSK